MGIPYSPHPPPTSPKPYVESFFEAPCEALFDHFSEGSYEVMCEALFEVFSDVFAEVSCLVFFKVLFEALFDVLWPALFLVFCEVFRIVFADVLLIGLCEGLCVVLDDDLVIVLVGGKVASRMEKKNENSASRNVPEFIDKRVRGCFDPDVEDYVPRIRSAVAEKGVAVRVPEPVVRQLIDASDFTASDFT